MTTIILTIIGILLAAAAALMVIFYGGDAFNSGSIGAQANTYQNAGTNVISAIQLAKADASVWTDVGSLHSATDQDKDYLKELPTLPGGAAGALAAPGGSQYVVTLNNTDGQAAKVCARINKNLKLATAPTVVVTDVKMGCATTDMKFFANA